MKPIDPDLWDDRDEKGELLQAELVGTKGKASLMRWLPSRAFDNGMFLLFANGIGMDCGEVRTGNSMILDPLGRTLAETDVADDAMVVAELDLALIAQSPAKKWMQARRPELFGPLTMPVSKDESPVKLSRPSLFDRSRSMPAIQRPPKP